MELYEISSPEELNKRLKDEQFIREFTNRVIFDGMSKPRAWCITFGVDYPLTPSQTTKMYRWLKKDEVHNWLERANNSLDVDWIDKRVNALYHLYSLGTDEDTQTKNRIAALDKFLTHLNKEESKIKLELGGSTQVNIIQVVQDSLSKITSGATIQPDMPMIEAEIE